MFAKALQRLGADIKATLDDVKKDMLEKPVAEQVELMEELVHELVIVYNHETFSATVQHPSLSQRYRTDRTSTADERHVQNVAKRHAGARGLDPFYKKMSLSWAPRRCPQSTLPMFSRTRGSVLKSQDTLTRPFENVVKQLQNDTPQEKENGAFFTFGPRDLYSIIPVLNPIEHAMRPRTR